MGQGDAKGQGRGELGEVDGQGRGGTEGVEGSGRGRVARSVLGEANNKKGEWCRGRGGRREGGMRTHGGQHER